MTFHEFALLSAGFLTAVSLWLMWRIWALRMFRYNMSDATYAEQYDAIKTVFYGHAALPMGRDEVYALLMYIWELEAEGD